MSRPTALSATFAHSRLGRAALHFACLVRGGRRRWHLRGIVRELRRLFCVLLSGALLGGGFPVVAFPGAPALSLSPSAAVDSSGIYLHQILSPPFSASPAQPIRLADAPAFGQAAFLTQAQIVGMLKAAAPDLMTSNWFGASQVRITRRARPFAERELKELLTATLQQQVVKEKGELELRFSRPWVSLFVPDETLALKVLDLPATGVGPNFIVRFELISGHDRLGPWQVVAQARVMKEVLIARSPLKRGQPLLDSDFTRERRDVLALREPAEESVLGDASFELVESVPAGQPLLERALRLRPIVQRGQLVDGLVRDGSLHISLKVEVLADGQPGQMIRVRNPKTKREFHAKVQNEQTVVINL